MGTGGSKKSKCDLIKDKDGNLIIINIDTGNLNNVGQSILDFEIIKNLGSGNFGEVSLVMSHITKKLYAMKKMKLNNNSEKQNIKREIKLLEGLNHKYVIKYFTSFCENGFYYIIIEYIKGKNLESIKNENIEQKKYLEEKKIWKYLIQCLNGLFYLHNKKHIVHRDIKPDNIILDESGNIKISDFGISCIEGISIDETLKLSESNSNGPMNHAAPEVVKGQKPDFISDMYMLGLTFFELASNKLFLYREKTEKTIETSYTNEKIPSIYSDELKNFIMNLLEEKDKRPNSETALNNALYFYTLKYSKVTSIMSTFFCLKSMKSIVDIFDSEDIYNYITKENQNNKYMYTKLFHDTLDCFNSNRFDSIKQNSFQLRYLFHLKNKDINNSNEITINDFILFSIPELYKELRTIKNPSINDEIIDESNEDSVAKNIIDKWNKYQSHISDEFYFISKKVYECLFCQKIFKYQLDFNIICTFYPDRAVDYLKSTSLDINDLIQHYIKKRKYTNNQLFCKYCNKYQNDVYITQTLYTAPPILIIELNYSRNNFQLKIEETIDIQKHAQKKNNINNYTLIGAIFGEKSYNNEVVYTSITKIENEKWIYFNGNNIQNSSFEELKKHNNLLYLFYEENLFDTSI